MNPQVNELVNYVVVHQLKPHYLRAVITEVHDPLNVDLRVQTPLGTADVHDAQFGPLKTPYTWHYPSKEMLDPAEKPITVELRQSLSK